MNIRNELICTWSAMAFAVICLVGLLFSGFIPPISPQLDPAGVAAIYQEHTTSIRLGVLLVMSGAGFICSFAAAIASQMKRIEGGVGAFTMTELAAGTLGTLIFVIAGVFWTAAAFRPDQNPELVRLLNDLGWICLLMTFASFVVQNIALGFCILGDKSDIPVFPRWVGYFNLWVAVLFLPGGLLTFFKTGPFAWDGLFVWWVPLVVFFAWYMTMLFVLLGVVKGQVAAQPAPA